MRCVVRQSSARAASCEVELQDDDAPGASVAAPLLWGPGGLLERSRKLGVVLGEDVVFEGVLGGAEARWSSGSAAVLALTAAGRLVATATPPPALTFQGNLQQFTWVAALRPRRSIRARGVASGLPALRSGRPATVEGLGDGWGTSYRIGAIEWTWDLDRGGTTSFDARVVAATRARSSRA